jgi:hypothetical protein
MLLFAVLIHYLLFPYEKHSQKLENITTLTAFTELSLGVRYESSNDNHVYPEMPTLGRMDFVYEQ